MNDMDNASPVTRHPSLLAFAHQLADAAGAVIRPYFGAHGDVEAKGDTSPVTIADREAEAAMRALIETHYPDHGIYGEEFGIQIAANSYSPLEGEQAVAPPLPSYTWVIDPIDGTRAFIAGRKEWGTLIALCENGVPVLGILDQPVTGERWVGVAGQPTQYFNSPPEGESTRSWGAAVGGNAAKESPHQNVQERFGSPSRGELIRTRACATLADAEFSTTSAMYFTPTQAKQVVALAQGCRATVKDGDCYAYGLLARGLRDMVVDAGLKPYDILALVPIIEGAGGTITGWDGSAVTLANYRDVVAVGDGALWPAIELAKRA